MGAHEAAREEVSVVVCSTAAPQPYVVFFELGLCLNANLFWCAGLPRFFPPRRVLIVYAVLR